jgi:subfamily B ATP-binding cassette protein HlyB/CyaB
VEAIAAVVPPESRTAALAFLAASADPGSGMALVEAIDSTDLSAQLVTVRPADLRLLQPPMLLLTADGTWLVVRRSTGRGVLLEGREGRRFRASFDELARQLQGDAVEISRRLELAGSTWRTIGGLVGSRRDVIVRIVALGLFVQAALLLIPQLTRVMFDRVLPAGVASQVILVAVGIFVVTAFQAWAGWLRARAVLYLETVVDTRAARAYLEHVVRLPFRVLYGQSVGDLMQGVRGLAAARELLTDQALPVAIEVLGAPLTLAVMVSMLPGATAAVCLAVFAMAGLSGAVAHLQFRLREEEVRAQSQQRGYLIEVLAGIATVKAVAIEAPVLERWGAFLRRELVAALKRQRIGLCAEIGFELVPRMTSVLVLVWGARLVMRGGLSVGTLMAFAQLAAAFLSSMARLGQAYLALLLARPQIGRADRQLAHRPRPRVRQLRKGALREPVVVEDVWFSYGPELQPVIKEFNLVVAPGRRHRVAGASGSGKTTLLRLIAGLYVPDRGRISVDGMDPASGAPSILYLPQFVQLYRGSIMDNLRILSGSAPEEDLLAAASETGLDAWVSGLPMKYHTIVPTGGGSFSGGQRQLIALTAALASSSGLLLLDEPMTNLDAALQARILESGLLREKTIVYVAHAEAM